MTHKQTGSQYKFDDNQSTLSNTGIRSPQEGSTSHLNIFDDSFEGAKILGTNKFEHRTTLDEMNHPKIRMKLGVQI